jgi:RNA polymerase sigma-70 factor, ECF subfamily
VPNPAERKRDDRELIAAMAAGDADALRSLTQRYAGMLTTLACRFLNDESDAEETAADVLWQAWRQASRFDGSRGSVTAWLVTAARSRAIDRLRARRARRPPDRPHAPEASGQDPAAELEISERASIVKQAVAELDPRERELLQLAYFSDLSQSEISARMGIPIGTVKTRMRTALIKLRDALKRLQRAP